MEISTPVAVEKKDAKLSSNRTGLALRTVIVAVHAAQRTREISVGRLL
jgi:hypothetical protein